MVDNGWPRVRAVTLVAHRAKSVAEHRTKAAPTWACSSDRGSLMETGVDHIQKYTGKKSVFKKMFSSVFAFLFYGKILLLEKILFLVACTSIQGNSFALNCACGRENCWKAAYRNPAKLLGRGERRENHRHIFSAQKKKSKWVKHASLLFSRLCPGEWMACKFHSPILPSATPSVSLDTTSKWLTNREQLF